jgi:hypothetical protein
VNWGKTLAARGSGQGLSVLGCNFFMKDTKDRKKIQNELLSFLPLAPFVNFVIDFWWRTEKTLSSGKD